MSNLTNQAPASTFGALLNTESAGGLTDIMQVIQDGFGHSSPLSLSTDSLNINTQMGGGFFIDNSKLNSTAIQIDNVCTEASFADFTTALAIPKGATGQRPVPPANGDFRYNTTTNSFEGYKGGVWVTFDIGAAGYSPGSPTYLEDTFTLNTFNLSVGSPIANFGGGRVESTIFGDDSLQVAGAGSSLVGIGYRCLKALTTASDVTGAGHLCLSSLTTGTSSTAFGKSSQEINQSGPYNTSIGAESLSSLIAGESNTAAGFQSLLACTTSFNTAHGAGSGGSLQTGTHNCFIGVESGLNVEESTDSCFIGSESGGIVRAYTGCTFIGKGAQAGNSATPIVNACAIGFGAVVEVDDAIVLGDAEVPTKVGIGTKSPLQVLHVENGNAVFAGQVGMGTTEPTAGSRLHVKDGPAYFENSNVGIGTDSPLESLHIVGSTKFQGIEDAGWLGTGIKKGQIGLVDGSSSVNFDFTMPEYGSQLVIKVLISAIAKQDDEPTPIFFSAGAESMCITFSSTISQIITNPSVTFSVSHPSFFNLSGEWSHVADYLRLQLTASTKPDPGDVYYVVSYEYFYSYGFET